MGINLSNISHAGLALACQAVVGLASWLCGASFVTAAVMGALLSIGFYWGREVAQAERKAGTPPWYSGFIVTNWSQDAVFDLLCPVIACAISTGIVFLVTI